MYVYIYKVLGNEMLFQMIHVIWFFLNVILQEKSKSCSNFIRISCINLKWNLIDKILNFKVNILSWIYAYYVGSCILLCLYFMLIIKFHLFFLFFLRKFHLFFLIIRIKQMLFSIIKLLLYDLIREMINYLYESYI